MDIIDIHSHHFPTEAGAPGEAIVNLPLRDFLPGGTLSAEDKVLFSPGKHYSAGIHPWDVAKGDIDLQLSILEELACRGSLLAIGEAGLDKLTNASLETQLAVFRKHIELAEKVRLPLLIHCVHAADELILLKKQYKPQAPWIWHGFRGKKQQALQLLRQGIYLSFGEHYHAETLATVPAERLFVETDTSSVPIETLLARAAAIRGISPQELRQRVQENICAIFLPAKCCNFE